MSSMACKQILPDILRCLTCMSYFLGESSSETFSEEILACTQVKVGHHTCPVDETLARKLLWIACLMMLNEMRNEMHPLKAFHSW